MEIQEKERQINEPITNKNLEFLAQGYIDYAKEVVTERAIPGIDGLKPSQRRILYTIEFIEKARDLSKSQNIVGATMKIHPHGDASIYDTMVRLVDKSETLNTPYLVGKGAFGKYYSKDMKASAARYTEVELAKISQEFFKGMQGIKMLASYNNTLQEPELLPVSFPNVLVNPSNGIAVGLASDIPSFNFHEIIEATIELIKTGTIEKPLAPDFPTKGKYIKNNTELKKLMKTGSAKIMLEGKYETKGRNIIITEIPYYATTEEIVNTAKNLDYVTDVKDIEDKNGLRILIETQSIKVVDKVVHEVMRKTPLQKTITTNICVIVDNKPLTTGVEEVLRKWVEFRESVVVKQAEYDIEVLSKQIRLLDILIDLMTTDEKREKYFNAMMYKGREEAKKVLEEYYQANEGEVQSIQGRTLGSLSNIGDKQREQLVKLKEEKAHLEEVVKNPKEEIINQLEELNKKYKYPRQTKIRTKAYQFDKDIINEKPVYPVGILVENMFIKKLKATPTNLSEPNVIKTTSDEVVSILDNNMRLLRIKIEDIPYSTKTEVGTYIPNLIDSQENFTPLSVKIIEKNKKQGYAYKDGWVAVVDWNEWVGVKRLTKITNKGLNPKFANKYLKEIDITKPYFLVILDNDKLKVVKNEIVEKRRTARSKILSTGKNAEVKEIYGVTEEEINRLFGEDLADYQKGLRKIRKDTFKDEELLEEIRTR